MHLVKLRWHGPFKIDEIFELDYEVLEYIEGFYTFLHKSKIIYVGQVYYKSLRDRIKEHLCGDSLWKWIKRNYGLKNISIKIAEIEHVSQKRITKKLVNDIEALLIATQQPEGNIQATKTYWGRDLKIVNLGNKDPLPETLSTDMLD